jgi:hypothetical protein
VQRRAAVDHDRQHARLQRELAGAGANVTIFLTFSVKILEIIYKATFTLMYLCLLMWKA